MLGLEGAGRRCLWPAGPGCCSEDDFCVEPALGLAVVARGCGAIGGQGKPAGKLAVWSVAGEVGAAAADVPAEARLRGGLERARVAIERLSANWTDGLGRPFASAAALLLDGPSAALAQIGDCRIARVRPDGLETLTREHTLAAMWPAADVPPSAARALTRALGLAGEPDIRTIAVEPGEVFLLAACDVGAALSDAELASELRPLLAANGDVAAVVDALARSIERRGAQWGRATFAVVRVGQGGGPPSRGSSVAPRLRWLYAPGEPLAEPPPQWAAGTPGAGPDPRWFAEVFGGVMGDD